MERLSALSRMVEEMPVFEEPAIREHPEGCVCEVRVRPGSSRSRVDGLVGGRVAIAVHSPPQKGRANREALRVLASFLGVPPSSLAVLRGETSRDKTVLVRGLPCGEASRILASFPQSEPR